MPNIMTVLWNAFFKGWDRLHTSVFYGNIEEIKALLDSGADQNEKDNKGRTAYDLALEKQFTDIAQLLHSNGAEPPSILRSAYYGSSDLIAYHLDKGVSANLSVYNGATPLHMAVWRGHIDAIRLLIARGAKVNPLLISYSPNPGSLDLAPTLRYSPLLELKRAFNAEATAQNVEEARCYGIRLEHSTPLDIALQHKHFAVAEYLRENGGLREGGAHLEGYKRGDMQLVTPGSRFQNKNDGTVTDMLTGLIWLRDAKCSGQEKTWSDATNWVRALSHGIDGLTDSSAPGDWRLPFVREFYSLIDFSQEHPALPAGHPFIGIGSEYWSCEHRDAGIAYEVSLLSGTITASSAGFVSGVLAVRNA